MGLSKTKTTKTPNLYGIADAFEIKCELNKTDVKYKNYAF